MAGPAFPPSGSDPSRGTEWSVVLSAVGLGVLAALHIGKVPPAILAIREDLGLGMAGAGLVVSMFNLLGMVLGLAVGSLADRIGPRPATAIGLLCLVAGGALGGASPNLSLILLSRAVEGFGFIALVVTMPGVVAAAAAGKDRPLALGLWSMFMPVGFSMGVILSSAVLIQGEWRTVWLGLAAATVAVGTLLAGAMPRVPAQSAPQAGALRAVLSLRPVWALSAAFGAYAFQWITMMVWLPSFLIGTAGLSLGGAAMATAVVVAINIPGNFLGGVLLRRQVPAIGIVMACSVLMATSATLLFAASPDPTAALALCLLFSFSGGAIPAVLFTRTAGHMSDRQMAGKANGMLMQGSSIGQFAGPPTVGAAVAAAGGAWSGAVLPMVAGAALTVSFVALATRQNRT